jgi:hypothetical protein
MTKAIAFADKDPQKNGFLGQVGMLRNLVSVWIRNREIRHGVLQLTFEEC